MQYLLIYISYVILALGITFIFLSSFKKLRKGKSKKVFRAMGISIMALGVLVFYTGDKVRVSMMKDQVVSYYNSGIAYDNLTENQLRNIGAIFSIEDIPDNKKENYFDAFEFYLDGFYKSNGYDEETTKEYLNNFLYSKMP